MAYHLVRLMVDTGHMLVLNYRQALNRFDHRMAMGILHDQLYYGILFANDPNSPIASEHIYIIKAKKKKKSTTIFIIIIIY